MRRTTRSRIATTVSVGMNIVLILLLYSDSKTDLLARDLECSRKYISRSIGVIMLEFEPFSNTISSALESFSAFDSVVILSDVEIYPPLKELDSSVMDKVRRVILTDLYMNKTLYKLRPETFLNSEYVLIVPDGFAFNSEWESTSLIDSFSSLREQHGDVQVVVFPLEEIKCHEVRFKVREWTLQFVSTNKKGCNYVTGTHVIMMETDYFLQLEKPFLRPVFSSIYIQLSTRNAAIAVSQKRYFTPLQTPQSDPHSQLKHEGNERSRRTFMYAQLGIKLVRHTNGQEEWHGCDKNTQRCFGTIYNGMPEYLYKQRWTPPCCLGHLRTTAKYVFSVLQTQGVRYWLEGGSLLGAVRSGDIIPWDYDVDIGIYSNDISKSQHLSEAGKRSYEDDHGFVWEKASEGDFYRVHYSALNHLHVDIFPFYSQNGIMTKDYWFKDHVQDTEFPEEFLQPLVGIEFVGTIASAPNNAKQFLELKFGQGVVENPQYPNSEHVQL